MTAAEPGGEPVLELDGGSETTLAFSGLFRGTSTTEIFECPWLPSFLKRRQLVPYWVWPKKSYGYEAM